LSLKEKIKNKNGVLGQKLGYDTDYCCTYQFHSVITTTYIARMP